MSAMNVAVNVLQKKRDNTMINAKEKIEKAEAIFKKEGTYFTWLRWKKRGIESKMEKMMLDVINRYGQELEDKQV